MDLVPGYPSTLLFLAAAAAKGGIHNGHLIYFLISLIKLFCLTHHLITTSISRLHKDRILAV